MSDQSDRPLLVVSNSDDILSFRRWPFVYAHGMLETLFGSDMCVFEYRGRGGMPEPGVYEMRTIAYGAALAFIWRDRQGMIGGVVVLTSDTAGLIEAASSWLRSAPI